MFVLDTQAFADFESAAREVLTFLNRHINFDLWMVTRTEGEDWIVLQASDRGYGIKEGSVFRWADSYCLQMVTGKGPRIALNCKKIPVYATAPINEQVKIKAYIGVPLVYSDGSLFGTLCAINQTEQSEEIVAQLPLIELLAKLLSTILNADLKATEQARFAEQLTVEALKDGLTGLYNRRAWDRFLEQEEKRSQQYGHPACVIAIDLDDLKQVNDTQGHTKGDELICQASQTIKQTVRKQDVVARLGGDEFAVLCVECNLINGQNLVERIQTALTKAQIKASIGIAARKPNQGLLQACQEADRAMYVCKQSRKQNF